MKIIIGISGYSGRETTFTKLLAKRLSASIISQDDLCWQESNGCSRFINDQF